MKKPLIIVLYFCFLILPLSSISKTSIIGEWTLWSDSCKKSKESYDGTGYECKKVIGESVLKLTYGKYGTVVMEHYQKLKTGQNTGERKCMSYVLSNNVIIHKEINDKVEFQFKIIYIDANFLIVLNKDNNKLKFIKTK